MNRLTNNLFIIFLAASIGTALLIWLATSFSLIQALLGLLVVLILPGYALIELLMGRRTLGTVQHLLMTLIASLAIAILAGLILNQLPFGVRTDSWIAVFVSAIAGTSLLAWLLRHRRRTMATVTYRVPIRIRQLLLMGVAVVLAGGALVLARTPAAPHNYAGYTMLWMIPMQDEGANHLQVGIDSKEFSPTQYKLDLLVDEEVAHEWARIQLDPNEQWQASLAINPEQLEVSTIAANLYRLDTPDELYRHVVLRPEIMLTDSSIVE